MSSFTEKLTVTKIVETIDKKHLWIFPYKEQKNYWITARSFRYYVKEENSNDFIDVPEGFKTDFASVPRIFWSILPPDGEYTQAAVLHDYLYNKKIRSRIESDNIFLEAMTVLEVPKWKREVMHKALLVFGWISWNRKRK